MKDTHAMTFDARAKGARCDSCPLRESTPVPPEANKDKLKFIVVAEGPGKYEMLKGRPLIGYSGRMLDAELEAAGLRRENAHLTNAVLCFGGDNSDKELEAAIPCCAPRLARELAELPRDIPILSLGAGASRVTIGRGGIQKYRGFVWKAPEIKPSQLSNAKRLYEKRAGLVAMNKRGEKKKASRDKIRKALDSWEMLKARAMIAGRTVMPTVHPAFILRGADSHLPVMRIDLRRLARIVNKTLKLEGEGPFVQTASPRRAARELKKLGDVVTVDIETDNVDPMRCAITCVGVADVKDPRKAVIIDPWNDKKHAPVLAKALAHRTVCTHNGPAFDNIALKLRGIFYKKNEDTLVAHRVIASHMPQSLAHVASVFCDCEPWKIKFKSGEEKGAVAGLGVSKEDLAKYNCLIAGTRVVLADGRTLPIQQIVHQKLSVNVLSLGPTGIEAKRVVGWHQTFAEGQKWISVVPETVAHKKNARGIVATPDHYVFTRRGRIQIQDVRVDDELVSHERALDDNELGALIGTALGDSTVAVSPHWRKRPFDAPEAELFGGHIEKSHLAQDKVSALRDFLRLGRLATKSSGYTKDVGFAFRYFTSNMRRQIRAEIMPLVRDEDWSRRLRIEALERLGPVGFAWWFMDDGCRQNVKSGSDSVHLAVCRYPKADVERAAEWLREKFGKLSVQAGSIYFSPSASATFCEHIAPYVFPASRYKLSKQQMWPEFTDEPISEKCDPAYVRVARVGVFNQKPPASDRNAYNRRFCLTVEGNHNFFTSSGLVSNCYDIRLDALAWTRMQPELAKEYELYREDMAMAELYTRMQMTGIRVDQARRAQLSKKLRYRSHALVGEMRKLLDRRGFAPSKPNDIRKALFGQLKAPIWLAPLTPTGLPSTAAIVLENLRGQETRAGALADYLIRWRSANDSRSEYLDGIHIHIDGRVHATWKQVETGRPAARAPNLLNLPQLAFCAGCGVKLLDGYEAIGRPPPQHGKWKDIDGVKTFIPCKKKDEPQPEDQLRDIYTASEGHELVYFDGSQIEMRFAAHISADPVFIEACKGDIHLGNACALWPDIADKLRADPKGFGFKFRQMAKKCGFAVTYVAEAPKLFDTLHREGFDVGMDEVEAMLDSLHAAYRVYYKYVDENLLLAQKRGWLRIPFSNRIRYVGHFPKIGVVSNSPVQGGVAAIMAKRLLLLDKRRTKNAKLIYYWYDAAIYDTPKDECADMEKIIAEVWAEPIVVPHNGISFVQPIEQKRGGRLSDF